MANAMTLTKPTAAVKGPRRRNADRKSETRYRILDATLGELVDKGYAGLTTQSVCQRAGVSKGAMFDHFSSKQALIVAANEMSNERAREHAVETLVALADAPDRLRATVEYLWEVYSNPVIIALTEVHMAARTDPGLLAALDDVANAHRVAVMALADALFPGKAGQEDFMRAVEVGLAAIMGGAVLHHTGSAHVETPADLDFLTNLLRPFIEEDKS